MKTLIAATMMLVWVADPASAGPDRFVCTGQHSVGLHYKIAERWMPSIFAPAKYILRKLTLADQDIKTQKFAPVLSNFPSATWAFFETGVKQPQPIAACTVTLSTSFSCQPISAQADFDLKTRRFQIIRSQGFIRQDSEENGLHEHPSMFAGALANKQPGNSIRPDDVFIEIGACRPQ